MSDNAAGTSPGQSRVKAEHATSVHLAVINSDFVLVFAVSRPLFGERGLMSGDAPEVISAASLNPITAKQLMRQLKAAIDQFEKATGNPVPDFGELEEIGERT